MSSLFAFLHHLAAFTLVSAVVAELVLLSEPLGASTARKILTADVIFGLSAGSVLVLGFLRIFYFEKSAAYYFSNLPFLLKLLLFAIIGVLSIGPTRQFLSWRKAIKAHEIPTISTAQIKRLKGTIYAELAAATALILCAALMARGIGNPG